VVFLVAFASIRFIWFKLPWRNLLFTVTYSYIGTARNWSHKRRTSSQGPKIEAKSRKQRWTSCNGKKPAVARAQPRKQTLFWAYKPPKMHTLNINFISFTAELYNALHMQGKKGDFGTLRDMTPLLPPLNVGYA